MDKLPVVALLTLSLLLAGCGNKGPLLKPSQVPPAEVPMPAEQPAAADDAVPAPAAAEPAPAEPAPAAAPDPVPAADDSDG